MAFKIILWVSIFIVFYTFFGYGILMYFLIKLRRAFKGVRKVAEKGSYTPSLTLMIAAYNEADIMEEKIKNTLALKYPPDKFSITIVTDGSTDATPGIVARYPQIKLMHSPERAGKIAAMHRAMKEVTSDVAVFTDANTFLNEDAMLYLARHYADEKVGCVSGEKKVHADDVADATAGEGLYWKYESTLKKWDAELYSVVGAAGELFSIRTALYQPVPPETILDDFMISLVVASKGYRIAYEPLACATEHGSESIAEELKRKVRIAAGGIQSIVWLKGLMNPFKHFVLTFEYISHRVLRWTVTPFLLILAFILNAIIVLQTQERLYMGLFACQALFYVMALAGWLMEKRQVKIKLLFIPYYFCMMNYAVIAGIRRYMKKGQSAAWEKAKRRKV
ncbi:MAG TPA: glycosyltransferase family 2 protein [Chitinophagaceae bacterium]|nr:glycosyltransferase family 2 protein [Chitinophagaceae bacterium]